MTRETKIGLLVGLAFIIVFAIILSEKGPSSRNSSLPAFSMVDRMGTDAASAATGQPLANAGKLQVDRTLPPIVQPAIGVNPDMAMREEEVTQGPRVGEEELPPLPDSVISLINGDIAPTEPTTDSVGRRCDARFHGEHAADERKRCVCLAVVDPRRTAGRRAR